MRYLNGPTVESSDCLSDGRAFQGIDEYKQRLMSDRDRLARALAGKLLSYATGAQATLADRDSIESIVTVARENNYGFRSMIHAIVQSQTFQTK